MRKWLLAVVLALPLVDALLLVAVADVLGGLETVLLVVLTALLGTLFVRAEGRHTLRKLQRKLGTGDLPTDELLDGGLLIAAGAFLLTPGLVSDLVGFLLVVPLTRYPIRALVKRWLRGALDERSGGFVTGNVYVGGFPDGAAAPGGADEDTYTVDADDYDVEFEDDDSSA